MNLFSFLQSQYSNFNGSVMHLHFRNPRMKKIYNVDSANDAFILFLGKYREKYCLINESAPHIRTINM